MTSARVEPGPVRGRIRAPGSKSYTHRALVAGHLAGRRFVIDNPLDADDTRATVRALNALGTRVQRRPRRWIVRARPSSDGRSATVQCGESGTTLRLATALAARGSRTVRFLGRGRLAVRPMRPLTRALTSLGARVDPLSGSVPFTVRGPIHGGRLRIDASESSQFTSALLLVLPTLAEPSTLTLEGAIASEPYIEATLAVERALGVSVGRTGRTFRMRGGQHYRGSRFDVPGDASSAAYLWAAAALAGGPVAVEGVDPRWPQADLAILDLLGRAGAVVRRGPHGATVRRGAPRAFSYDLTPCPDLYPLAGVLAAAAPGRSVLLGADQVVHKESDRRRETARLVTALGGHVKRARHGLVIEGGRPLRPLRMRDLTDHRLLMAAAVGALAATGPSRVGPAEAVGKSYPKFWDDLRRLGAEVAA